MASYEEIAPELSKLVTQEQAEAFAANVLAEAPPVTPKTIDDLGEATKAQLRLWLQWFGREKQPANLPHWIDWSPKRAAKHLGFSLEYIKELRSQRAGIVGEVATYTDDAFKAHASITSLTYEDGDLTIAGKEFLSVAEGAMGVRMHRPEGASATRTKEQIETGEGTYTNTVIVVKAATLPLELLNGDEFIVVADGLDSPMMALVVVVDEPEVE